MLSERNLQMTQAELARVSRLTTMGELAASIAHEVNQPLTAVTNNGSACLRLLANSRTRASGFASRFGGNHCGWYSCERRYSPDSRIHKEGTCRDE